MLEIKNLSFGYNAQPILKDINLMVPPGKITAVIGPNAAGKSTLLKCIGGILKAQGIIRMAEKDLSSFSREEMTRLVGYLSQDSFTRAVLSVFEVVLLGRLHSLSLKVGEQELNLVMTILRQFGLEKLASRDVGELSGGQRQMVFIAQALVREPRILLLDEPTNSLDLHHQLEILDLLRSLTQARNLATVITLHQLDLAARYADELVVLHDGAVYAVGRPETVLTPAMLRTVYRVNAKIHLDDDGIPHVMLYPSGFCHLSYRQEN